MSLFPPDTKTAVSKISPPIQADCEVEREREMWRWSWLRRGTKNEPKSGGFPVLKGHPAAQQHAEKVVEAQHQIQGNNVKIQKKEFKIYRWSPNHPHQKPFLQSFFLHLSDCGPMVIYLLILPFTF